MKSNLPVRQVAAEAGEGQVAAAGGGCAVDGPADKFPSTFVSIHAYVGRGESTMQRSLQSLLMQWLPL
jgi:hypothetical protein